MSKDTNRPDHVEVTSAELAYYLQKGKRLQSEAMRDMFSSMFAAPYRILASVWKKLAGGAAPFGSKHVPHA